MRRQAVSLWVPFALVSCAEEPAPPVAEPPPPPARLVALPVTDHVAGLAREPMVVELSDGTLFVTGYGEGTPALWRSGDGGATWETVDVGTAADGAVGNSDVDLALGPDGTLYFAAMSFDRESFEGLGIAVGTSADGGTTWAWDSISRTRFDDRPWIEVAPDGVAHLIWNDGAGVWHAVSADRGGTWTERARIHAAGGSSHLAIGPSGTIAVRVTPLSASGNRFDPGLDSLAISTDGGTTWTMRGVPGTRAWTDTFDPADGVLRWVEPLAWDSAGALYSLWSEGTGLVLGRSVDDGASWSSWAVVEDTLPLYFPYLTAHGNGVLYATWHSSHGDALRVNLARFQMRPDGTAPHVTRSAPIEVPSFRMAETDSVPVRDPAGEYVPVLMLRDGRVAIVTTIQDPSGDRWGFTFRPFRVE